MLDNRWDFVMGLRIRSPNVEQYLAPAAHVPFL